MNTASQSIKLANESVKLLDTQALEAWTASYYLDFPYEFSRIKNIVFSGMGGSALGAHIFTNVFKTKVPFVIKEDYELPSWVSKETLVILSSYSGNTEETLSCATKALERGCLITGFTSGGKLQSFFEKENIPHYLIQPAKSNPSNYPRFGIAYGLFGIIGMLTKLNLIDNTNPKMIERDVFSSLNYLKEQNAKIKTKAATLTKKANSDLLLVFSAEHLQGNGHTLSNQLNETSKKLAYWLNLPDADHSQVESYIRSKVSLTALFLVSQNYKQRVKERFEITEQVLLKAGYKTVRVDTERGTLLQEALEALLTTSYISVELAKLNKLDPLAIPSIDKIKKKLEETDIK